MILLSIKVKMVSLEERIGEKTKNVRYEITIGSIELRVMIPSKIITEYNDVNAKVIVNIESKNEASQTLNFKPMISHKRNIA